jgi:hypothetical protein
MRGARAMRGASVGLTLVGLAAAATHAEEVRKIKKVAKGNKEVAVSSHASFWNKTCEFRGLVEIYLDEAPKGGTVCMRQGIGRLAINEWCRDCWSGRTHCLGKRIRGVFVIYVPYASFTGNDVVRYTVTGVTSARRTYEAEIRVETGRAPPETTNSPSEPQKAGPMPVCPMLVS